MVEQSLAHSYNGIILRWCQLFQVLLNWWYSGNKVKKMIYFMQFVSIPTPWLRSYQPGKPG